MTINDSPAVAGPLQPSPQHRPMALLNKSQSLLVCTLLVAELVLSTSGMIILIAAIGLVLIAATRFHWQREVRRVARIAMDAAIKEIIRRAEMVPPAE